jgi:hypothetical protein
MAHLGHVRPSDNARDGSDGRTREQDAVVRTALVSGPTKRGFCSYRHVLRHDGFHATDLWKTAGLDRDDADFAERVRNRFGTY